ncbi:MAG: Gfo/Idh/MocA family oxidoreductase [Thermoguttaceae bacterium]|nr:Gfo/Idh/MocA family oxidoreductase [Thermoguttaceae bacterium]
MSEQVSRRKFLTNSIASVVLTTVASPVLVSARALGRDGFAPASETVLLGGIGINHRGGYDLGFFLNQPDVRFVAVADVAKSRRERVKKQAEEAQNTGDVAMYRDFRELLDRQDVDAVLSAPGDRWHAHMAIYAARAGKDVYSEKPCAITIELCRKLAETMKFYGAVFQGGTQRRNVRNFRRACELARSGQLGDIREVHASIYYLRNRTDWLPGQQEPDPEVFDWDLWLGPAPWRPYNEAYANIGSASWSDWRGYYDFDSGFRHLDWGAHTVDLCQWALGADGTVPVKYWAEGDKMFALYENGVKLTMRPDGWLGLGTCPVRFEGTKGWVETGDSGKTILSDDSLRAAESDIEGTNPRDHIRDFLDCVKTRRQPTCNADVIRSSHIACHVSALSWYLGRELTFDPKTESFVDDEEANRLRSRADRAPWTL